MISMLILLLQLYCHVIVSFLSLLSFLLQGMIGINIGLSWGIQYQCLSVGYEWGIHNNHGLIPSIWFLNVLKGYITNNNQIKKYQTNHNHENELYIYTFMFIVGNHNAIVTIPIFFGADEVGIARFSWNALEHSPLLFLIYKWGPFMALWIPHGGNPYGMGTEYQGIIF